MDPIIRRIDASDSIAGLTLLTSAVVRELQRMNLPTIVLNVNQSNETAVRVYERLGFVRHCDYCEGLARDPLASKTCR